MQWCGLGISLLPCSILALPAIASSQFWTIAVLRARPLNHRLLSLARTGVTIRFKELMRRAGLDREGLSVHALPARLRNPSPRAWGRPPLRTRASGHSSVQTTVRYTQENIENLRRRYLRAHPRENEHRAFVDDAYRANLAELQERLTKAAHKRAVVQARKTRVSLIYRKED